MDKIYSRRRIKLPIIFFRPKPNWNSGFHFRHNRDKKNKPYLFSFFVVLIMFVIIFGITLHSIEPIIDENCSQVAKSAATKISNTETTKVMKKYQYNDLCSVEKDTSGNIKMIRPNVITINEITSDIAVRIQNELNNSDNNSYKIRAGNFTGSRLLAGVGPNITLKVGLIGDVKTEVKSEFISQGINQTLHRIYMQLDCEVTVIMPFKSVKENISNQVLLTEAVIVGDIPDSYYNLEGIIRENLLDTIN